jgi:hypothetical protein
MNKMLYSEREDIKESPSYDELFQSAVHALDKTGVLTQMRAQIRYSVFESAMSADSGEALMHRFGNPKRIAFTATGTLCCLPEPH